MPVSPAGKSGTGDVPFSNVIADLVQETNQSQQQVSAKLEDLVTGQTDSVHDVVLSVAKADLSFRLMMEIRDRLITSYQEIMRMQV